jgi:5-methylcytosine-specific restriction endonuclease McrA
MIRPGKRITEMLLEGKKYPEITRELGVASSTIAYHARKLGMMQFSFERRTYDWKTVQEFYDEGNTLRDTSQRFGMHVSSVTAAASRGEFDLRTHCPERRRRLQETRKAALLRGERRGRQQAIPEILCEDSLVSTGTARKVILRNNLIPYRCDGDGCPVGASTTSLWCGNPLSLHLDHKNGIRNDHRLENLRWLCPNCHSQTETYCGRNKRGNAKNSVDGSTKHDKSISTRP